MGARPGDAPRSIESRNYPWGWRVMIFQTKAPRGLLYWIMEPHLAQMINQEERNKILENMFGEPREREREREERERERATEKDM